MDSINDKLNHIKKLLFSVDCNCDILKLVKCINCKLIICDNCNNKKCDYCNLRYCDNCVDNKTYITDPNISWYMCIKCEDNVKPSIYKKLWK